MRCQIFYQKLPWIISIYKTSNSPKDRIFIVSEIRNLHSEVNHCLSKKRSSMGRPTDVACFAKHLLFTDLGLLCMVALYCVGGAYLFRSIEYDTVEEQNRGYVQASQNIETKRDKMADDLAMYKWSNDYNNTVEKMLADYQDSVRVAIEIYKYNGMPTTMDDWNNGWAFTSAILFTISVVTTIGYGQITPVTPEGQMVLVLYAVIGVPMNLLFLSSNGKVMAGWFRHAYNRGCCYICWKQRKATFNAKRKELIWYLKHGKLKQSDLDKHSTQKLEAKMKSDNDIHFGEVTDAEANKILQDDVDVWCQFVEIMEHIDEDKNVPISLVLIVMACYLFLGSVLFSAWNGWSYAKSAYFCFVSLSTIGFGDVVANVSRNGTKGDIQTMVIYIYIYFGLSVVSMSFNLMIAEMKSKIAWVLSALGLSDKENTQKPQYPYENREYMNEFENSPYDEHKSNSIKNAPEKFGNDVDANDHWPTKGDDYIRQETHRV